MRVLVTGSTGFIGNYVIKELLSLNHEVIATSRSIDKAKRFEWFDKVQYVEYDIETKMDNLYDYFLKPDLLIHLAWEGLPNYKDSFHVDRNLFNHCFFLKGMIENGLNNLSVVGTCAEYGMKSGQLTENEVTEPSTFYAIAKDTLRKYVEGLYREFDFKNRWIRLFYMYGKGQSEKSILSQLEKALISGDETFNMSAGEQLRDYLKVEDVAKYIVDISLQDDELGIVNCCSGQPISIRKLVENYLADKGKSIKLNLGYYPYVDYEPMAFWGDNAKLKLILDKK